MTSENRILVLGGTGKTGRRIAERLQQREQLIRIGSRSAHPPFDWRNTATWADALAGVHSVYISFQPDVAVPGAVETIRAFTQQAAASGIRRVVMLSGRGEDAAQHCEQIVQQSGMAWTIIRASWFNQNFSEGFLVDDILRGEIVLPVGDVLEPFVDAEDIADIAVTALTANDERHSGQLYEVTGPRLMTFQQAIAEIAAATGRELPFVQVSPADYAAGMQAAGVPDDVTWLVNYLFTTVLDGRNSHLADGVERALGRGPRDFSDYVHATATTNVWTAVVPAHAE